MASAAKRPLGYDEAGVETLVEEPKAPWCDAARAALRRTASSSPSTALDRGGNDRDAQLQRDVATAIGDAFAAAAAARSEVEVIIDTLSELEQGQRLTVAGSKKQRTRFSASQRATLAIARKRNQLASVAGSLRQTHEALSREVTSGNRFHEDLARLQRAWKVRRSPSNASTGFCFDLSLRQLQELANEPNQRVEIFRTAEGELYVEDRGAARRIAGVAPVHAYLRTAQTVLLNAVFETLAMRAFRDPTLLRRDPAGAAAHAGLLAAHRAGLAAADPAVSVRLRAGFLDALRGIVRPSDPSGGRHDLKPVAALLREGARALGQRRLFDAVAAVLDRPQLASLVVRYVDGPSPLGGGGGEVAESWDARLASALTVTGIGPGAPAFTVVITADGLRLSDVHPSNRLPAAAIQCCASLTALAHIIRFAFESTPA